MISLRTATDSETETKEKVHRRIKEEKDEEEGQHKEQKAAPNWAQGWCLLSSQRMPLLDTKLNSSFVTHGEDQTMFSGLQNAASDHSFLSLKHLSELLIKSFGNKIQVFQQCLQVVFTAFTVLQEAVLRTLCWMVQAFPGLLFPHKWAPLLEFN